MRDWCGCDWTSGASEACIAAYSLGGFSPLASISSGARHPVRASVSASGDLSCAAPKEDSDDQEFEIEGDTIPLTGGEAEEDS